MSMTIKNKEIVKKYFNKYFKSMYLDESSTEFRSLLRILNKKDRVNTVQRLKFIAKKEV